MPYVAICDNGFFIVCVYLVDLIGFGHVLQKIVDKMQNVPDARAVDAFKQQVLQKQMVLETLVEENSCTLELLKHDVVSMGSDLQRLKSRLRDLQDKDYRIPLRQCPWDEKEARWKP